MFNMVKHDETAFVDILIYATINVHTYKYLNINMYCNVGFAASLLP